MLILEEQVAQSFELCSFLIVAGSFLRLSPNLMQRAVQILNDMEAVSDNGDMRKDGVDGCSIVSPQVCGCKGQMPQVNAIGWSCQPPN